MLSRNSVRTKTGRYVLFSFLFFFFSRGARDTGSSSSHHKLINLQEQIKTDTKTSFPNIDIEPDHQVISIHLSPQRAPNLF